MKIKRVLVVASTSLLCFHSVFFPVISTITPIFAIEQSTALPQESELSGPLENTTETQAPIFSFEENQESYTAGQQFFLVIHVSQEVSEFVMDLPKEVSIVEDQPSTDIQFTNIEGNQWQMKANSPQVTFSIPLMIEEAGEHEVVIGDSKTMLHVQRKEIQQTTEPETISSQEEELEKNEKSNGDDGKNTNQEIEKERINATRNGTWGTVSWSWSPATRTITLQGGDAGPLHTSPWNIYANVTRIIVEGRVVLPENSSFLFLALQNLESIENAGGFDTSNVTNMSYMFTSNRNLETLNVSNWDTSNVTNMSYMFTSNRNLETLNVSNWDTSNVTNMAFMFSDTQSLTNLDLRAWDTSSVTNMSQMFYETNLKSLTLGEKSLFSADTQLPAIQQIDGYTGGWKLESGTENLWIRYASSSEFMTNYDGRFPGTYTWETFGMWGTVPWIYDGILETITLYGGEAGVRGNAPWKTYSSVKQIIVEDKVILPANSDALFWSLQNLESIENAGEFDTSNVTNMYYMFGGTNNIKTLDLSNWDTSNVTNMAFMFTSNRNLETLNVSNWDTSNVTNMRAMFQTTERLKAIDASSWNTSRVTDMGWMFNGARSLETLNISNWNTTNVSVTTNMFLNTTNLSDLRLGTMSRLDHLTYPPAMPTITSSDNYTGSWVYYLNQANTIPEAYITSSSANFWREYDGSNPGTYQWQKKGSVALHYRDINDQEIIASEIITGGIREPFQIEEKAIEGYTLQETSDNTSGRFTEVEQAVIFRYMKNTVDPVDPLNPEIEVDPESKPNLPEDQGLLSIDFVSSFNFGSQSISVHDQTYYAQPQRLLNEDGTANENEVRPNYVQISDRRPESERNGWELAVTQQEQFKGNVNQVLNGASITLLNQQIVTAQGGTAPELQSVHPLIPGNRQRLLKAQGSEGMGTWIYRFGDAETAKESVALNVPKGANPEATTYSTKLTWELSSVPDN